MPQKIVFSKYEEYRISYSAKPESNRTNCFTHQTLYLPYNSLSGLVFVYSPLFNLHFYLIITLQVLVPKKRSLLGQCIKVKILSAQKHCLISEPVNENLLTLRMSSLYKYVPIVILIFCIFLRLLWILSWINFLLANEIFYPENRNSQPPHGNFIQKFVYVLLGYCWEGIGNRLGGSKVIK